MSLQRARTSSGLSMFPSVVASANRQLLPIAAPVAGLTTKACRASYLPGAGTTQDRRPLLTGCFRFSVTALSCHSPLRRRHGIARSDPCKSPRRRLRLPDSPPADSRVYDLSPAHASSEPSPLPSPEQKPESGSPPQRKFDGSSFAFLWWTAEPRNLHGKADAVHPVEAGVRQSEAGRERQP